jgi:hypothetical protein
MYEKYYQEYCNEVHKILASFLFWRMIQNRTASEDELLDALNKTPLSWIFTRHSLQVTLFITLGRVFDIGNDAFSVDDLLKCCIEEIDIFSHEKLRSRKIDDKNGNEPEWLPQYIENAYEPTKEDFNRLRGEVTKRRKVFEAVYRPIRHKLIAHNDKEYMDKADELWAETNIQELEDIIWFLNDLKETLFDSFYNGWKPELKGRVPDLDFYEHDFGELLDTIKNA